MSIPTPTPTSIDQFAGDQADIDNLATLADELMHEHVRSSSVQQVVETISLAESVAEEHRRRAAAADAVAERVRTSVRDAVVPTTMIKAL